MLVVKATIINDREVMLDKQTFDQLVQYANQTETVKIEETQEKLPPKFVKRPIDNNELLTLWRAANYVMPKQQQDRMQELLEKNSEGQLTSTENDELDVLIDKYEQRTMEKAEALVKLNLK